MEVLTTPWHIGLSELPFVSPAHFLLCIGLLLFLSQPLTTRAGIIGNKLLGSSQLRYHDNRRRIRSEEKKLPGLEFAPHDYSSQFIVTSRGVEVHVETWYPVGTDAPKGAVYVCHGYGDSARWMQRYIHAFYLKLGFAVCAVEYEGHGYSSGYFVYIHNFQGIVQDCQECFDQVHASFEARRGVPLKRFISGESMGGGVALCLAIKQSLPLDGLILCAPMCRIADHVRPPVHLMKLLTLITPWVPKLTVVPSKIGPECTYKDPTKRKLSTSNPFRFASVPRLRSALSLLEATEFIESNMGKVNVPILILHGSDDKVTDPECSKQLYDKVSSCDKTLNIYPGVWHAFLGEPTESSSKIFADISNWITERIS